MIVLLLTFLSLVHADDSGSWMCEQTASKRNGSIIYSCGVGEGLTEGEARAQALRDAFREFNAICDESSDCKGRPKTVDPQRTSCKKDPKGYVVCYRLIVTTLGD